MDPNLPILIIIGSIAGVMSGMFGIGGGAIIVPALVLFIGFDQTLATGTSLAALLLPVGVFGCIAYYNSGKLKIKVALSVAFGLLLASWFGAMLALNLPEDLLKQMYGVLLLVMAWRYIAPRKWYAEWRGQEAPVPPEVPIDFDSPVLLAKCFGIGLVAGVASGLFGIGGGVIIVPALTVLLKFDQKLATGTSLGALLLPVGLPAVVAYNDVGDVSFGAAAPIAVLLLIGAFFGARVTLALPTKTVRRLYGFFLLFVGLRFLLA